MSDPRISKVAELLLELAAGNLAARGERSPAGDEIDAIIAGINMLAEELAARQDELDRVRQQRIDKLQARLAHADRLSSLGRLAAGVAHEVNNPATTIVTNQAFAAETMTRIKRAFEDLRDDSAFDKGARRRIDELLTRYQVEEGLEDGFDLLSDNRESIQRICRIVKELSAFSRIEKHEAELVDLAEVVEAARKIAMNEIRHRARLVTDLGVVPSFVGDRTRLVQAVVNMLINAAQAIEPGEAENNRVTLRTWSSDTQIMLTVEDTGCGIAKGDLDRIFEPFYTTKPRDVGTGLGLALALETIEKHGGTLTFDSTVNVGTTFQITLPRETGLVLSSPPEAPPTPERSARRLRILLIDDEAMLRKAIRRALADHEVVEVGGGHDALEVLDDNHFDLILCDLMMPNGDGKMLYDSLRDSAPELLDRLVFITGGVFTRSTERFVNESGVEVLQKPISMQQIRALASRFSCDS